MMEKLDYIIDSKSVEGRQNQFLSFLKNALQIHSLTDLLPLVRTNPKVRDILEEVSRPEKHKEGECSIDT